MKESCEHLFQQFLGSDDGTESDLLLRLIREHAQPIINLIIRTKLRVSLSSSEGSSQNQDALEVAGDVRATILAELQSLKAGEPGRAISNFQNYVALKTYSACADYFRAKNPQRRHLKDVLRYHLKQNPAFALWETKDKRWLCGMQAWRSEEQHTCRSDHSQLLLTERLFVSDTNGISQLAPAELLTTIFESVGHPIAFDHLVSIAATGWGIRDQPTESLNQDGNEGGGLIDSAARVDLVIEQRLYLQRLWTEVGQLPPLQRSALLLNLRDAQGGSVIAFIPHLGIASKQEIAEMLSMSNEEFLTLWNELPLEDLRIADLLGVTRQQVINLRKTARERLARRMKAIEKNSDGNKQERRTV